MSKGSGQFIYASVVINFISDPNQHPARQLEIVLELDPSGSCTPFAQLDALYRHILSQVVDIEAAFLLLAYAIFARPPRARVYEGLPALPIGFGTMTTDEINVALAALTPVLTYDSAREMIIFLHASLPDFLVDQDRSQDYHLDKATWSAKISILLIRCMMEEVPIKLEGSYFAFLLDKQPVIGEHPAGC